jgi:hypothetical protein
MQISTYFLCGGCRFYKSTLLSRFNQLIRPYKRICRQVPWKSIWSVLFCKCCRNLCICVPRCVHDISSFLEDAHSHLWVMLLVTQCYRNWEKLWLWWAINWLWKNPSRLCLCLGAWDNRDVYFAWGRFWKKCRSLCASEKILLYSESLGNKLVGRKYLSLLFLRGL